ncbi:CHAT domain-containing tetratricopeptide repeat protein [Nocardia barduliensis]|uniref:CHAT domain-containing tetratricopeptide repeat protein n=1 Tax=Nocardia barduliensis TaxID=2736643 RepID=UPI001C2D1920|nr:CHAT domain-containing protein [Nocardia barduliensis]
MPEADPGQVDGPRPERHRTLTQSVMNRLRQADLRRNRTLVLGADVESEAAELESLTSEDDLRTRSLLGWLHWYRLAALPVDQGRAAMEAAVGHFAACFLAGEDLDRFPPPVLPTLADEVEDEATRLLGQAATSADLIFLDRVAEVWKHIVVATPVEQAERAQRLLKFGAALKVRFDRAGMQSDLTDAIAFTRRAVDATATADPNRASRLTTLGVMLRHSFIRYAQHSDIDDAVSVHRQSVAATPLGHHNRGGHLSDLANSLSTRFERFGALADICDAVDAARAAVNTTSMDNPSRAAFLNNLATKLSTRFRRTGELSDLEEAVSVARQAVDADLTDRPGRLANLANALSYLYLQTGESADGEEAAEVGRRAVGSFAPDAPERAGALSNLGIHLRRKFEQTHLPADLDEAVDCGRKAVAATAQDNPIRAFRLSEFGRSLHARFEQTQQKRDFDDAADSFLEAVELRTAEPSVRIPAARSAAYLVAQTDPGLAAKLLDRAVRLLTDASPRRLARSDGQYALGRYAGLAADAAALALTDPSVPAADRPAKALQLLELGRAVLFGQTLQLRTDLTDLTAHHPQLALRFTVLREQLDSTTESITPVTGIAEELAEAAQSPEFRRQLADELEQALIEIRSLEGFAGFALPPSVDQLTAQAAQGSIALFNISEYRCDAILVTPSGVHSILLPGLSVEKVVDQVNTFHHSLLLARRATEATQWQPAQQQLSACLRWLWDNAAAPVLDELGHRQPRAADTLGPRVWWSPGGLLGLLPIHAAGYHTASEPRGRTVLDRVVSSYVPTVAALRHARRASGPAVSESAVIVAMPTTPHVKGRLASVTDEVRIVSARTPSPITLVEPDPNEATPPEVGRLPTRDNVLSLLRRSTIAHFACHGISDSTDPSRSRLLLRDHTTKPLTVSTVAAIHLDDARLAYLSACQTALTTDQRFIDEAIHLTSAFQLAGYRHVVGTLWAVNDSASAHIAEHFYAGLSATQSPVPDIDHAAHALHHAVRDLRDAIPAAPFLWASHLHVGA